MATLPIPAQLPATGYIRLAMLLSFLPYSSATVWRKLKDVDDPLPRPYKLGPKITAWKVEEVRAYLDSFGGMQ
ncbi:MAG: AlpA family phage regulatory protein [Methylococcaceae bacterium]